ncbi:hypothetical protein DIURU_001456 [Diutina rugosa]|uniref:ATP-dependent 6-phosphofructokinase n=1 Tax=Diutina rugosa TaxID=5481 RepID=A0A642UU77_DIURU|nr:uncharacterized protein DIURU_001456 [Diutina rugosa]KAA8905653.1 hypothetical protein DIURU_001456 [Diutina rugosa]
MSVSLSYASIVVTNEKKLEELYHFYTRLGFRLTKSYSKAGLSTHPAPEEGKSTLIGIASDSIRELWLESFPLQDTDAATGKIKPWQEMSVYQGDVSEALGVASVLKLRLSSLETPEELVSKHQFYFFTTNLDQVQSILERPFVDDHTIYAEDPVGTELIFSTKPTPTSQLSFSDPESYLDHRKQEIMQRQTRRGSTVGLAPVRSELERRKPRRKIAVMTSGGDAPGMNPAVRAVVRSGIYYGCDVFAICEGYSGMVKGGDYIKQMTWSDVRGLLHKGGTAIGTARCKEFREREGRLEGAFNLISHGIDGLIVIGGDGSLTGADALRQEWPSLVAELESKGRIDKATAERNQTLTIAGLVGSIDNDMAMTDSTIGASSALARICELVDYIDATAQSHSRAFVVEVMGRHCGWLGLMSGIACGADYIFIPEHPPSAKTWKKELMDICKRHREKGRRKTTVIVSEGAIDDELNPISSETVKEVLVELGLDTRITKLGHVQRGGAADAHDRLMATLQGVEAVKAVLNSTPDTPSPMISMKDATISCKPLMQAVEQTKQVAKYIEAKQFDKAMSLRESGFSDALKAFCDISHGDDGSQLLPEDQRLNIGIIHVGAPSAGLNAATRAAALVCLAKGHRLYAIYGGFSGLIDNGKVKQLEWLDVEEWHNQGGSEIGTNRSLPSLDYGKVAYYFQKYKFDGLMILGGFEAFTSLHQLHSKRKDYPIFSMPMVVVPATISNNVPGTEYSMGSNTCLDELVRYCDAVNQSASASRRRVFVVEVMGGHSGYVASYCGLVTGALAIYTPEERVSLHTLEEDIQLLTQSFADDRGEDNNGKLIIRNEQASTVYTTDLVADIIREQAKGRFETRTAIPGYVQQGYTPSPLDRIYAVKLATHGLGYITSEAAKGDITIGDEAPCRAKVVGIVRSKNVLSSIDEVWNNDANVALRKGKTVHWSQINKVSDMLSGRLLLRQHKEVEMNRAVRHAYEVEVHEYQQEASATTKVK